MVRNSYTPKLKLVRPWLFFHTCKICHVDFKGEAMWRLTTEAPGFGSSTHTVETYCCTECAATEMRARKLLMDPDDYKKFIEVEQKIKARIPLGPPYE